MEGETTTEPGYDSECIAALAYPRFSISAHIACE